MASVSRCTNYPYRTTNAFIEMGTGLVASARCCGGDADSTWDWQRRIYEVMPRNSSVGTGSNFVIIFFHQHFVVVLNSRRRMISCSAEEPGFTLI